MRRAVCGRASSGAEQPCPRALSFWRLRPAAALLAAAGIAVLSALLPAAAQGATLVSNVGQARVSDLGFGAFYMVQEFTTGANGSLGFTLSSVELRLITTSTAGSNAAPVVKIYSGSARGTLVATLVGPSNNLPASTTDNYTYAVPSGTTVTLADSTNYWVVADKSLTSQQIAWVATAADGEDATSRSDWAINNNGGWTSSDTGTFSSYTNGAFQIRVNGDPIDTTPPTLTRATVFPTGTNIQFRFSEEVGRTPTTLPPVSAFTVTADGSPVTLTAIFGSGGNADRLSSTVSPLIRRGQAVVVTYTDPTMGDDASAIQDLAGNDAASFTTGSGGVPAVTNSSTLASTVPANWSLKPTDVAAGAKFRLLFLSSTKRNGSSTDIATYNTFVQDRAAAGHTGIQTYSAGFRAVGCTAAIDARDNTSTTYTSTDKGVPIYWLNGAKAADEYEDFYDGSWDDEANDKNESGTDGPDTSSAANYPITGCDHDGTEDFFNTDSRALGVTGSSSVRVGRPDSSASGDGPISSGVGTLSINSRPMYGLSEVFQVNNAPTVVNAIPDQTATAGTGFSYQFPANTFNDVDTDTLSYTATKADGTMLPTWLVFTASTRTFSGTPAVSDVGIVSVKVTADDSNGGLVIDEFDLTVSATAPGAPASLTATASGSTAINLSWTAPASNGGSVITGYKIEISSDGGSSWNNLVANAASTTTTYEHTGLTDGTTRHYRVSAINANGTSLPSNVDDATTDGATATATAPGAPTGLTATASGSSTINLSWSAPASNGGSAITGYRIEASSDSGSNWSELVANTGNPNTTYAHMALAGGTTRHYRVSAINANGTGLPSNVDGATTGASVPGPPTSLSATSSGSSTINLSWTAPSSTGGSAITGYKIEVSSNGGSNWSELVADTGNTNTTYAHSALADGATRHYRVSAINAVGTGPASSVDDATTGQTTVTFDASSYTAEESGAPATVTVELSEVPLSPVTIPLVVTHLGRATTGDYEGLPSSVTFWTTGRSRTFTVRATDDSDVDAGESVQIGFGPLPTGYEAGTPRTATVALVDDETELIVDFGTGAPSNPIYVRESDTDLHRITFSLKTSRYSAPDGNLQQPVTIPLVVTHRGGATPDDYEGLPSSVTFAVGESVTDFTMRAIPDRKVEIGEGLRLDFGVLPAGVRKGASGPYETIEFVDEHLPDLTVWFGAESYTAAEGGASAQVSIHLSGEVEVEPLVVQLSAQPGGGATSGDYAVPLRVTFAVGERTKTIEVVATDDEDDDDGESVSLSFVNADNDRLITANGPGRTTVALGDNDAAGKVAVSFAAATYTATEGGSGATVRVELDKAPGRSVTVPLAVTHLGGASPADYSGIPSTVTFGANQTEMAFTVNAANDSGADGGESMRIGFGALPQGVLAAPPAAVVVTLADGSAPTFVVNFDTDPHSSIQVREGNWGRRVSVFLGNDSQGSVRGAKPPRPVTVPLVVTHTGGATAADYAAIPASVTFEVGKGTAGFDVRAISDGQTETGEGLRIDFGALPPGVTKGSWGYKTIAFVDADAAAVSVSGPLLTLSYPGALDGGSTPSGADFVVLAGPRGGEAVMPVTSVWVDGNQVLLALERPVAARDTVTLTYLMDAMHPIRDAKGLRAAPLADEPVRNVTGIPPEQAAVLDRVQSGARPGRLDLSSRNLTDLSALSGLSGVRELDLRDNAITDLSPLSDLSELEVLDLSGNRIEELWPLAGLPGLVRLNLSDNRIEDIATLSGLSELEVLDLSGNRIEELWPLAGLTELERLNLSANRITDIAMLSGLSGLDVLLLNRNRVADVEALSPLTELANLGLSDNRIEDIGLLANLGRLGRLDLSGNAVADVTALGDVSELLWLRLPGNPVSDVAPLGRLEMLRWLWIDPGAAAKMEALALPGGRGAARLWIERVPAQ